MRLSDERVEEIRATLSGESQQHPAPQPAELAALATELQQLRLRVSSKSRSANASIKPAWH